MEDYLSKLNEQQKDAVIFLGAPQLVIAGAGSGKTRVLTYKILHLIAKGFEPYRILALTFTNKAAREMRERIAKITHESVSKKIWMGTFHSIFLRILHIHAEAIGFKSDFTIYDTADSKSIIKAILKDMNLDEKVYKPSVVLNSISMAKNALISPEGYVADRDLMEYDKKVKRPLTYAIYRQYAIRCRLANVMDFDDILFYMNVLLRDNKDILNHYREFFRYVLVDEYQDTNFAQHLIITRLTEGQHNLTVVGDDAQSIYSFRGANIGNILNLKRTYPNLQTFKLERNYRSTRNITDLANSLIDKNREQIKKNIYSEKEAGFPIELVKGYSDFEESYLVANRISKLKLTTGDSYNDFAILYRTNAQSRILEESLRKRNIPYKIYGNVSFYQRKEVKDVIAYFRLTVNPTDDEALKRIINFPARGIGETTLNKLSKAAIENEVSIWEILNGDLKALSLNAGTIKKLEGFKQLISSFITKNSSGMGADVLAKEIVSTTGLLTYYYHDNTPESIAKQENVNELINGVSEFVSLRTEEGRQDKITLTDFLSEVSLATDFDNPADENGAAVTLMTAHASKGLEFNNVFIVGVEEDLFPSVMSQNSSREIEEERRLLYVAITRAANFCMLSYASSRYRNGETVSCRPSRFLNDLDKRFIRLETGTSLNNDATIFTNPSLNYLERNTSSRISPLSSHNPTSHNHIGATNSGTVSPPVNAGDFVMHTMGELEKGNRIIHSRFGEGIITDIDTSLGEPRIIVEFVGNERKTLLLKFAKFKILK